MKKFCKKGIGVVLAATMATGGMAVYASEATKDGSGAAGISGEAALEEVDGSQFAGEEWYDQRATFQVNREKAHTSFTSFQTVEDAKVRDKSNSPFYQLLSGPTGRQKDMTIRSIQIHVCHGKVWKYRNLEWHL